MTHERARARLAGLLAVATATASTVVLGGTAAAAPGAKPAPPATPVATVTLLTGDRVTLGGPGGVAVRAAKGREHISFLRRTDEQGDLHVIPQDAATSVSTGKLDPRLFDVTALVRAGYDDAKRKDLPLIVDYPGATPRSAGARITRELPAISAVALRADKGTAFWPAARALAKRVWLDGPVRASLDHSVPQIGAPQAWAAGYTGAGTKVAVLDTGIDVTHPDLDDAVAAAQDFTGSATGTDDHFGHGTHVASIITGDGDPYKGVAPDAKLLNGKVLDNQGGGAESWIIAGMEWAAHSGADVISMSLGSPVPSDGTDPMSQAVNQLTADTGALFVIAAGNSGSAQSIGSPGAADAALTVGAVDRNDQLADFSSQGPRWGDGAIKPDITAPGVGIVAARAAHGQIGDPAADGYVSLSGTSMATPHVAGAAAIVAGQHPDWTATQLKSTLMASAKPNPGLTPFQQGAGRVDVAAAVSSTVAATPPSIGAGVAQWPHEDDQPIVKPLSYTNSGTEPVTLDVTVAGAGPAGAAPAGMFTVSPSRVSVPAGGHAEVNLTIDTTVEAPNGTYTGTVTATGAGLTVRTPLAVNREVESYNVTVRTLDHDGAATPQYFARFVDIDKPNAVEAYDESGTVVARVPKGRYYVDAFVQTERPDRWLLTQYTEPDYVVSGDAEVVIDAREGKAVDVKVDEPNAQEGNTTLSFLMTTQWGDTGSIYSGSTFDGFYVRPSTTSSDGFEFDVAAELAEPDGTGTWPGFHASPYLYHVRWREPGRVPTVLERRFANRDLAKVRSDHAVGGPSTIGMRNWFLTGQLPFTLTEFYTPNVAWYDTFGELASPADFPGASVVSTVTGRVYEKGRTAHERWNVGVVGPAFPVLDFEPGGYAQRLGDQLGLSLPLHADQSPYRDGSSFEATGTTELLRDGVVIGSTPYSGSGLFDVPADTGSYTVRTTATRPSRLSTSVSAAWTFASSHVDGSTPASLPLLAVRFAPSLDSSNAAPAGRFRVPVYVQRNGSPAGRVSTPSVEVSFDDGKSWKAVRVSRDDSSWAASVDHPQGARFVSLRASVSDREGNSVSETILRAYAVR